MIIGIIGVLKTGAAYVPIDPEYPIERIQYTIDDCQAKAAFNSIIFKYKISRLPI